MNYFTSSRFESENSVRMRLRYAVLCQDKIKIPPILCLARFNELEWKILKHKITKETQNFSKFFFMSYRETDRDKQCK